MGNNTGLDCSIVGLLNSPKTQNLKYVNIMLVFLQISRNYRKSMKQIAY